MTSISISAALKRIESRFRFDGEVCSHVGPVTSWLDGSRENSDVSCNCGKSHITIYVGLSDGSDRRTQIGRIKAEAEDILDLQKEAPEIPIELRCKWASQDYGVEYDLIYEEVQRRLTALQA